jgi:hypothetical protein
MMPAAGNSRLILLSAHHIHPKVVQKWVRLVFFTCWTKVVSLYLLRRRAIELGPLGPRHNARELVERTLSQQSIIGKQKMTKTA